MNAERKIQIQDAIADRLQLDAANADWRRAKPAPIKNEIVVKHKNSFSIGRSLAVLWFSFLMLFCTSAIVLAVRPELLIGLGLAFGDLL